MKSSSNPSPQEKQYTRARDHPLFDGMRRGNASVSNRGPIFNFLGKANKQGTSRSASDIGDRGTERNLSDVSGSVASSLYRDSASDIIVEPSGRSSSGRWSKNSKAGSPVDNIQSKVNTKVDKENNLSRNSSLKAYKAIRDSYAVTSQTISETSTTERSFSINRKGTTLSRIPLPPTAAFFYNGYSTYMEVVESCDGIHKLNMYLKSRRDEINAGVPGKFLHAVLGQDSSDVGSIVSTIMYSFYLNESLKSDQLCTVPVINIKRADLNSHAELKWLLDSCNIDQSFLIFIDEIDLSYYDLFGSLKLVLLNRDKLPDKQEALKEALVEIFNSKKGDTAYSWVDNVTVGEDWSCCTLIAEKFALDSPEIFSGRGFSRLLLAGILLDTGNLTNPHCTDKDKYMATLLINGAGQFGCTGLYEILRYKMHDVSDLKVGDILRKDFKKWTRIGKSEGVTSGVMVSHVGLSSVGIPIAELLAHDETSMQQIIYFQQFEKLRLHMIVSGYYDSHKNFKREILVSAESTEVMKKLLHFFTSSESQLLLKDLHQPGLRDEIRAFEMSKSTSRRTIERLLEEFGGMLKC